MCSPTSPGKARFTRIACGSEKFEVRMTSPRFDITPKIAPTERDLRFHPSPVTEPKTLSKSQVESFNRDGYLKGIRIFDSGEIAEHRRYFDDLLARVVASGGNSYS